MTGFTELTLTCPHCGVAGKPQKAKVGNSSFGIGWAILDERGDSFVRRGLVTCEACKAPFAFEVDAVPVVRVAPVVWNAP